MIILKRYRLLERLIGLGPFGGKGDMVSRTAYLLVNSSLVAMELAFIILNIHDGIERAVSAFAPLFAAITTLACYIHLFINRRSYHSLLNEMQKIVNESEY